MKVYVVVENFPFAGLEIEKIFAKKEDAEKYVSENKGFDVEEFDVN